MNCNSDFVFVFNNGEDKFKRLSKPNARKAFNAGKKIYLLPCKVSVFVFDPKHCSGISPCVIEYKEYEGENQFDRTVNAFEYYNCNSQLGYYAHYYIRT